MGIKTKPPIKVTVTIVPGLATPPMKIAYRCFWSNLVSQLKDELRIEEGVKSVKPEAN